MESRKAFGGDKRGGREHVGARKGRARCFCMWYPKVCAAFGSKLRKLY